VGGDQSRRGRESHVDLVATQLLKVVEHGPQSDRLPIWSGRIDRGLFQRRADNALRSTASANASDTPIGTSRTASAARTRETQHAV